MLHCPYPASVQQELDQIVQLIVECALEKNIKKSRKLKLTTSFLALYDILPEIWAIENCPENDHAVVMRKNAVDDTMDAQSKTYTWILSHQSKFKVTKIKDILAPFQLVNAKIGQMVADCQATSY